MQACAAFQPLFSSARGCAATGLVLQWGVGFAVPMAMIWVLELRSRRAYLAQACAAPGLALE